MSHFLVIASNENGIITDEYIASDLKVALDAPFEFSDVFIYSHGWWNTPNRATQDYNRFTVEFASAVRTLATSTAKGKIPGASLGIGIYWPSMLSADPKAFFNLFQATSFYTMEKRADAVGEHAGYFLLQTIANAVVPPKRLNLIGHSFGCKVVCNALQIILDDKKTVDRLNAMALNLVLLQGALDSDHLEKGDAYGDIAKKFPNLRVLATISDKDKALHDFYPMAQAAKITTLFGNREALGASGPTIKAAKQFGGLTKLDIGPGFARKDIATLIDRFVVGDISRLHTDPNKDDEFSGHHSDIFLSELYQAVAGFIFGV